MKSSKGLLKAVAHCIHGSDSHFRLITVTFLRWYLRAVYIVSRKYLPYIPLVGKINRWSKYPFIRKRLLHFPENIFLCNASHSHSKTTSKQDKLNVPFPCAYSSANSQCVTWYHHNNSTKTTRLKYSARYF